MLIEEEAKRRAEAKARFIAGLWNERSAEKLLSMAAEAGLTLAVADELIQKVERAQQHVKHSNELPRLRKAGAETQERLDKAQSRLEAETARLEAVVEEASFAASCARNAVNSADAAVRELLMIHDEGLLPKSDVPEELQFMLNRRDAEDTACRAHQVRVAAEQERNLCRAAVRQLEDTREKRPMSITSRRDDHRLDSALEAARKELDQAEARLKAADAAVDAAVRAIPRAR